MLINVIEVMGVIMALALGHLRTGWGQEEGGRGRDVCMLHQWVLTCSGGCCSRRGWAAQLVKGAAADNTSATSERVVAIAVLHS